jgi:hypothetical protein
MPVTVEKTTVAQPGCGFDRRALSAIIITLAAILTTGVSWSPVQAGPGQTALDFLNIPADAHGAALGQAAYAAVTGPQAIFSNAAHLGENTSSFASYQKLLMDTHAEAAAFNLYLGKGYSSTIGIRIFSAGKINGYSGDDIPTGDLEAGDMLVRLGFARMGRLSYGVSLSHYTQRLDDRTGNGLGAGLGISYEIRGTRISFAADNIGPDFEISGSKAPLPSIYSLSAWIPLPTYFINLNLDLSYRPSVGFRPSAGIEYTPISSFVIRAGTNEQVPVSLGLGLAIEKIEIDYSYLPSSLFGDRHLFSFTFSK